MNQPTKRFEVVDALRGFAIISIMLLHNLEHFDFYFTPPNLPSFIQHTDKIIWDTLFFLFSGKVYAIFSLLFGLTFFIQFNNQAKKGKDFRLRFAWRMLLLLAFGTINSAFYEGDILSFYALIGIFILPFAKLNTRTVFWIAVFLMIQPYEWGKFILATQTPDAVVSNPLSWSYFGRMGEYITGDSILKTFIGNLTNGKKGVFIWSWEQGRVFQTLALFLFGMLAGRKKLFDLSDQNKKFWKYSLIIATLTFIPLFLLRNNLGHLIESRAIRRPFATIVASYRNLSFMIFLVSGFTLLFQTRAFYKLLHAFSPMGRMSLSNYIIQSVIGATIYYGYGFGLYQYTGATYSLGIGILLALLQSWFSTWWFKSHRFGPLEYLWHKATWIGAE